MDKEQLIQALQAIVTGLSKPSRNAHVPRQNFC